MTKLSNLKKIKYWLIFFAWWKAFLWWVVQAAQWPCQLLCSLCLVVNVWYKWCNQTSTHVLLYGYIYCLLFYSYEIIVLDVSIYLVAIFALFFGDMYICLNSVFEILPFLLFLFVFTAVLNKACPGTCLPLSFFFFFFFSNKFSEIKFPAVRQLLVFITPSLYK